MLQQIKKFIFSKDEEVVVTDKTNEIMEVLKSHQNKNIKHIVKVKTIETVRKNLYEAIKADEAELTARLEEVKLARKLFETTLSDLGEKELSEDTAIELQDQ